MKKIIFLLMSSALSLQMMAANPKVIIKTSQGEIEAELFQDKAPITVKNFLSYVKKGHYKDTLFHRVINNFMIQGGGFGKDMREKPTDPPIKNEADNGLKNEIGTLAMARTNDVDSAAAQFFINVETNPYLDHKSKNSDGYGYCVFGKVTKGMPVVNKIKMAKTGSRGMLEDMPIEPIVILDIVLKK